MSASKAGLIAELRARIAGVEASAVRMGAHGPSFGAVSLGAAELDAVLPGGGLRRDALHEVMAADYRDMGAAMGFLAALAARFADGSPQAPVLWCEGGHAPFDVGALYGPGLAPFGLDPARLIVVSPAREVELLWTMEEALRLGALAAVVGEIDGYASALDLTATRRLQLAAEEGGTPVLILTGHHSMGASAAATRWRIAAAPSRPEREGQGTELIGRPRWQVTLDRCRGAEAGGEWIVEWDARRRALDAVPRDMRAAATPLKRAG
jgi:protein ImuA